MNIQITDTTKCEILTSIFQNMKLFSNDINIMLELERMFIQSMDSGHVSIIELNIPNTIEILEINNNLISSYDFSSYVRLNRLIIFSNPLKNILLPKYVLYVDLSETQIENISNLYKIEHLVLNSCNFIRELPQSDIIKTIELINTPIEKLYFYKNYELILTQLNLTKNISSKYKKSNANIQIRKNLYLVISKGINIIDDE